VIEHLTNLVPEGKLGIVVIIFVIYMMLFSGRVISPFIRDRFENKWMQKLALLIDIVINFVFALIAIKLIIIFVFGGERIDA